MTIYQILGLVLIFAVYPFGFLWFYSWHCHFCSKRTKVQRWGANGCDKCVKDFLAGKITPPSGPLFEAFGCKRRDPRKKVRSVK